MKRYRLKTSTSNVISFIPETIATVLDAKQLLANRGCRTLTLVRVFLCHQTTKVVPLERTIGPRAVFAKEMSTSRRIGLFVRLQRNACCAGLKPTEPTDTAPTHPSHRPCPILSSSSSSCSSGIVVPLGKLSRQVIVRRFGKEYFFQPRKGPMRSLVALSIKIFDYLRPLENNGKPVIIESHIPLCWASVTSVSISAAFFSSSRMANVVILNSFRCLISGGPLFLVVTRPFLRSRGLCLC